ncbi:hypothetical protein B0H21DRAFT_890722 [Amylocystis lapponica]|nr:hypothetical protein B0H21DRAFT_890722 [Amylocystis lapponica]
MSHTELPLPSVASAPFNNLKGNADIILRSSDLVDFFAYKVILAFVSPVFEDMFAIPQPPSSVTAQDIHPESGLPIILLTENSATLDRLLRVCYPMENPVLSSVADVGEVLWVAQKYEMKEATTQLSRLLLGFSEVATYAMYGVACKYGLEDVAHAAALAYWRRNEGNSLNYREQITYEPEMDGITAGALFCLLRFCYGDTVFEFHRYPAARPATAVVPSPPLTSHPFDKPSAKSDLLVQSSDGFHFHVIGLLLAVSSPVFAELIDQLPDTPTSPDARVIAVTEDSQMLLWILHFCYPMEDPLEDIVSAGRKYHLVRMTNVAKRMCGDLAITDALRAYLIAMREGWEEVANEAAKHAVYQRHDIWIPEMEDVTANAYYRLLVYRCNCLKAISDVSANYSAISDTLCTTHWSRSALYVADSAITGSSADYDTLQIRFGMLTVVQALGNQPSGVIAPAAVQSLPSSGHYRCYHNNIINDSIPKSNVLAGELRTALLEVGHCIS